jgi:uncharacterized protein (TIGR03437 family)
VYPKATVRVVTATVLTAASLFAQGLPTPPGLPTWRHIGNTVIDRSIAGLATGPVDRVWYGSTGTVLAHTFSGRVFETADFETWRPSTAAAPPEAIPPVATRLPESAAKLRGQSGMIYAVAKFAYKSENGGASWENLTSFRGSSILGDGLLDLAVSPSDDQQIVVAGANGVFRSMDGGKTWSSLNQSLPNLPASKLLALPSGDRGARLALNDGSVVEWQPGQKIAWTQADNTALAAEAQEKRIYATVRGFKITAMAKSGTYVYLGMGDGLISASPDNGLTWKHTAYTAGPVQGFWVDPSDPRVAFAVFGSREPASADTFIVRTANGGIFWDDYTSNLPHATAHAVTADDASKTIYIATDAGGFMASTDFHILGMPPRWTPLPGLPDGPVMDVTLDAQANQLWAAVDGYGVFSTLAPHRLRDPKVVSTADMVARATAPGALVSVLGARVQTARAGDLQVPVLDANDTQSQLQIPFEARGTSVSLALQGSDGRIVSSPVQLEAAAPAIFADGDGSPMLLDAESGLMLDAMNPAHSRGRIQILATGLGRVNPDWPTGLPGPVENPPAVVATVHAFIDRQPVEVTRAVLAPYIGFYLIELEVPKIVNYGPAELYLEVNGQASNRVRVYIEP